MSNSLPARGQKGPFRRKVLRDHGVAEGDLRTLDLVDAALGALTGLFALEGCHSRVGAPDEGVILLPVRPIPHGPLQRSEMPALDLESRAPMKVRARFKGATVQVGYVNRNAQTVIAATDLPGTDHGQYIYVLQCDSCNQVYGSNGSDNFQRKCPNCQGGRPGLEHLGADPLVS